ncbi:MAG: hypothetical protein KGH94_01980 [Candidatus Micrarchaeota archaeon]|nr:hypothetical protein [Candidatus Micrarchaeota archaeon]
MAQKIKQADQPMDIEAACRIMSEFGRTGKATMLQFNEAYAVLTGHRKLSFKKNWEFAVRGSTRALMLNAARLARAEGNINHALSLEARIPHLPKNSRYLVGRSKNGCSTAQVVIRR